MSETQRLGRIFVYPIKSLGRVSVREAVILPGGSLQHDREFALFDRAGNWINGKRDSRVHLIRAKYDLPLYRVTLSSPGDSHPQPFHLLGDQPQLEEWFSDFFGLRVYIKRNLETGFPDDLKSPGPTVISTATIREVGSWFHIGDDDETSRRFRANIEIKVDLPFWEDRFFGIDGEVVKFRIGDVMLDGVNPCQRCVVPSRDSFSGVPLIDFQRAFVERRAATLPDWATASRFNHYYRLSINTRIPASEAGKILRAGDCVIAST